MIPKYYHPAFQVLWPLDQYKRASDLVEAFETELDRSFPSIQTAVIKDFFNLKCTSVSELYWFNIMHRSFVDRLQIPDGLASVIYEESIVDSQLSLALRSCPHDLGYIAQTDWLYSQSVWMEPLPEVSTSSQSRSSRSLRSRRLSPKERERRRLNNLCAYCGGTHQLSSCPRTPA